MEKKSWSYTAEQYATAALWAFVIFDLISYYLYRSNGYFDLSSVNKAAGDTAVVLLGIVLLIGPGGRAFKSIGNLNYFRTYLGIVAFFFALIHGIISLFFLPDMFPLSSYVNTVNIPFYYGLTALLIMLLLFLLSGEKKAVFIGRGYWWKIQYWGVRFAFILTTLHIFIMKGNYWISFYTGNNRRTLPSAGLLVAIFMTVIICYRIVSPAFPKFHKALFILSLLTLLISYIVTFLYSSNLIP